MLIGLVGFIGAGKSTVGNYLASGYSFTLDSYARTLKDCLSLMFNWPRDLLEGDTVESRRWREEVDPWWAGRLGIPDFSPRRAMQLIGTEALREHFHPEIWVMTVERRILQGLGKPMVLADCRFPDEIDLIRRYGGVIVEVQRGPRPVWYDTAAAANRGDSTARSVMETTFRQIHRSEWAWVGQPVDRVIENNAAVADLAVKVANLVASLRVAKTALVPC